MKRTMWIKLAALGCAALLTGCLFPRYNDICELYPTDGKPDTMTLEAASATVKDMIENPASGKNTNYPKDKALGKYTTSIKLRRHNRTGLVLIEVHSGKRVTLEFYVHTQEEGEKFAAAVWRLRREYINK